VIVAEDCDPLNKLVATELRFVLCEEVTRTYTVGGACNRTVSVVGSKEVSKLQSDRHRHTQKSQSIIIVCAHDESISWPFFHPRKWWFPSWHFDVPKRAIDNYARLFVNDVHAEDFLDVLYVCRIAAIPQTPSDVGA
jgi:hypothetical protein